MISEQLAQKIQEELTPKNTTTFNLNFKIEGENADKFDQISKTLKKSRTELAKMIINNSLDDLLEHLVGVQSLEYKEKGKFQDLDKTILKLTKEKISALKSGDEFELKELIGKDWNKLGEHGDKNRAGKTFKRLIDIGSISNVKFILKKSNNHALYKKL